MELGAPSWWLIQSGSIHPLIFEVKAIEQIHHLLKPALRHALSSLIQSSQPVLSRSAGNILDRLDEVWLVMSGMLEAYYLKTWNASFSEHFYGLKRKTPDVTDWRPWNQMPLKRIGRAWVFLVAIPYLKGKCDQYLDLWNRQDRTRLLLGQDSNNSSIKKLIQLFKRIFLKVYYNAYTCRFIHYHCD